MSSRFFVFSALRRSAADGWYRCWKHRLHSISKMIWINRRVLCKNREQRSLESRILITFYTSTFIQSCEPTKLNQYHTILTTNTIYYKRRHERNNLKLFYSHLTINVRVHAGLQTSNLHETRDSLAILHTCWLNLSTSYCSLYFNTHCITSICVSCLLSPLIK